MADIADKLLKLMYEWIEEAQDCSSNLRALADELVKLRNNCNTAETVGSTVAVVGSVLSIGAAFFTAGASLALLGVVGGVGAGVSIVTKITEALMSSSKLKRITEIDKKCTEITDEIKRLYDQLREKCPSSSDDQKDHYVTKEILKAISRRNCLEIDTDIFDDAIRHLLRTGTVQAVTTGLVVSLVGEVLFMFSLLPSLALKGGAEAGKAWVRQGASRFLGVLGLALTLPELIDNWKDAVGNKHETKASQSVRDIAEKTEAAQKNLSKNLSDIENMLEDAVKNPPKPEPPKSAVSSFRDWVVESCVTNISNAFENIKLHSSEPRALENSESFGGYQDLSEVKRFKSTKQQDSCLDDKFGSGSRSRCSSCSTCSSSSTSSSSSSGGYEDVELKMLVLNARSVNKFLTRKDDDRLTKLMQDNKPDVALISETWFKEGQSDDEFKKVLPPGYDVFNKPRGFGRGGGVAIAFADKYECYSMDFEEVDVRFEYTAALLCRPFALDGILVLNIYRPPKQGPEFFKELEELLTTAFSQHDLVLIGGDFNIWVDCPKKSFTRKFQEVMDKFALVQHVQEATHDGGHTLDLVQSHASFKVTDVTVKRNDFSDHHTVLFNTHFKSQSAIRSPRSVARRLEKQEQKRKQEEENKKKDGRNK